MEFLLKARCFELIGVKLTVMFPPYKQTCLTIYFFKKRSSMDCIWVLLFSLVYRKVMEGVQINILYKIMIVCVCFFSVDVISHEKNMLNR